MRRPSSPTPRTGSWPAATAAEALDGDGGAGESRRCRPRGSCADGGRAQPFDAVGDSARGPRRRAVGGHRRRCGPRARRSWSTPSGWRRAGPPAPAARAAPQVRRDARRRDRLRRPRPPPGWPSSSRSTRGPPNSSATVTRPAPPRPRPPWPWPSSAEPARPGLAAAVETHLRELALPRARFSVDVDGPPPADQVTFGLGANPGEPVLPLAKVASGGELARTMLAARLVLTAGPPTLVFDEVDAGIGGEAAVAWPGPSPGWRPRRGGRCSW